MYMSSMTTCEQADAIAHNFCLGCGLCALNCPTGALGMEEQPISAGQTRKSPSLKAQLCVHCGRCAAVCPSGTIQQFHMEELLHRVRAGGCHGVAFFCSGLNLLAPSPLEQGDIAPDMPLMDARLRPRMQDIAVPQGVLLEEVRCTGRLGARLLLRLVLAGVREMVFFACPPDKCQYGHGATGIHEHVAAVKDMLAQYGAGGVRLEVHTGVASARAMAARVAGMAR